MVWIAPAVFSAIFIFQAAAARKRKVKVYKLLLAISLLVGAYYLQTITAKVIPVLIQLMLMYFFGRTLLKDKGPPFIESFVRLEFTVIPAVLIDYVRQLTIIWTAFFAFNAVMCVLLAIFSNDKWWALYNGVFIYLMIGLLTTVEYIYRRLHFPELTIPDPKTTVKNMFVNGRKIWMDVQTR